MTEEEMQKHFEDYPHADLVRAVYQMKTELVTLYDAVNKMAQMQETHSQVLAIFVDAFDHAKDSPKSDTAEHRPGMYL